MTGSRVIGGGATRENAWLFAVCALMFVAALALSFAPAWARVAHAAAGTVYSCEVHPAYEHPVTGEIEDAGGVSARATGQAMVDSCVSAEGMMEVAESGECFLTMRMSLVDLTSGHTFYVQDWGDTGWSTAAMGVTATGHDANGTTNDVCIQLPSASGIVRVSMVVESMGREVVFYVYASDLSEPAPAGFNATIVTEAPTQDAAAEPNQAAPIETGAMASEPQGVEGPATTESQQDASAQPASDSQQVSAATQTSGSAAAQAAGLSGSAQASGQTTREAGSTSVSGHAGGTSGAPLDSTMASAGNAATANATEGAGVSGSAESSGVQSADGLVEGAGVATAQGLSLSTTPEGEVTLTGPSADAVSLNLSSAAIALWAGVVGAGLVLMCVAAVIVYFFRRNWNRWGGYDPDDYSREYRHG